MGGFPLFGKLLIMIIFISACATTWEKHKQNPDGSWEISSGGNSIATHQMTHKGFDSRANIVCPNGYELLAKTDVNHSLGKPETLGRVICKGREQLTLKKKDDSKQNPESKGGNFSEKLRNLKKLKDEGILTDDEYKAQKSKLLDKGI